jgi:iron complex transport system ATP-binding protein
MTNFQEMKATGADNSSAPDFFANSNQPPLIQLQDAVVRRKGKEILNIESFKLHAGENIALLGPNGAGKSTFIKLITREVFPLHRDIPPVLFRGNERTTLQETKEVLGVVSSTMQDQITVHLPAFDIVAGGLFGSLGIPAMYEVTPESRKRVLDIMESLGVLNLAKQDIKTLSTGQARRILLARALIHDPEVLVFDEPTTGLDPEGMYYVRKSMRDLVAQGKSIILVTHYPEDIIPEVDRVVMIKDGKLFNDGTKAELLTSEHMTELFGVPLRIIEQDGYFSLVSEY